MKKLFFSLIGGIFVSVLIFLPFWFKAYKLETNKNKGHKEYCHQIDACNECKQEYNCLKNRCSEFGESCYYIEKNWESFPEGKEKEKHFVNSLCGMNSENNAICQKEYKGFSKFLIANVALGYLTAYFGGGLLGIFQIWNFAPDIGVIILLIPIIISFFIGIWLKIREK